MIGARLNVIFGSQEAGRVKDDLEDVGRSVAEMESTRVSRELERAGYHPTTHRHGSTQSVIELSRATGDGLGTAIDNVNRALAGLDQSRHETWLDWQPEGVPMPALLSHDELLGTLRDRGIEIPSSTLEHYRRNGILPRPIRRWHGGATRPVYPEWMVDAIEHLRELQNHRFSLEEIAPMLRNEFSQAPMTERLLNERIAELEAELDKLKERRGQEA